MDRPLPKQQQHCSTLWPSSFLEEPDPWKNWEWCSLTSRWYLPLSVLWSPWATSTTRHTQEALWTGSNQVKKLECFVSWAGIGFLCYGGCICKVVSDFAHFNVDDPSLRFCLSVCLSFRCQLYLRNQWSSSYQYHIWHTWWLPQSWECILHHLKKNLEWGNSTICVCVCQVMSVV